MLAGLFYTRAAKRQATETKEKGDDLEGDCATNANKREVPFFLPQHSVVANDFPSASDLGTPDPRQRRHSDEFISSADIFGIGEPSAVLAANENYIRRPILDEKASLEKIKPVLLGWLVRKRLRSLLGRALVAQIVGMKNSNGVENKLGSLIEHKESQRTQCISRLVSFLVNGVITNKDGYWQKKIDKTSTNVPTGSGRRAQKKSGEAGINRQLIIQLYSSDENKKTEEELLGSLQEAVGMKNIHRDKLLRDITPVFLFERRSAFLRTIFALEDFEERFPQVPRLTVGDGQNMLSSDRSFISTFGGEYFQLIDNVNHICGNLR
ncbi:hypothetical protein, conserved [Trypanosoma cruzi]|uniref:Uncharacterized protein n=1 Tax=Trypanosoma cruzi (strain CL Brener) TaxID=353153 RepID=Q4CRL4_TRYCC|nr:hypothetical protein, conserved [Trypanosoma cruzi]EAN82914.1 hypothetical protein, conserved [Trypanosoma cruzi]|eukprot:XP_804765.1 hypothetical protein [Trypanosoma cruzi strain CL Brener]